MSKKRNIFFLFIPIFFFYFFLIYSSYRENKDYLFNTTINNQIKLVQTYKKRIDEKLLYQKKLIEATADLIKRKDPKLDIVFIKEILSTAILSGGFNSVYIGYNDDYVISGLENWVQIDSYKGTERPWYKEALYSADTIVTRPYLDSVLKTDIISIVTPIFKNNVLYAVLASDLEFDAVQEDISSLFPLEEGFAFIMTRDAHVLLRPNKFGINFNDIDLQEFLKQFSQDKNGNKKYLINNKYYIFTYDSLANSDWLFVSVLDETKIYEQLDKKAIKDFIVALLLAIFGISFFIFLSFTQRNLYKNIHLLELFAKSSIGAVLMTNKEGYIVFVNKSYEKIFSIQYKSIYGKHVNEITNNFKNTGYDHKNRLFFDDAKKNPQQIISFKIKTDDLFYHVQVTPLLKYKREFEGILVTVYDVTHEIELEYKKQEQEQILIQNSKMAALGEMVSAISHQWRQPLNTMLLIVSDLEDIINPSNKPLDVYRAFSHLNRSRENIELMNQTITIFRNFYKEDFSEKEFNLLDALEDVLYICKPQIQMNGIEIKLHYTNNNFNLKGYPTYLKQVLLNVITNSKDELAIRKKDNPTFHAYIFISISEENNLYIISVEDNGLGINPKDAEKIFEPFFTTKGEDGTGTGLYISKLLFEKKMKGNIKLDNFCDPTRFLIILEK